MIDDFIVSSSSFSVHKVETQSLCTSFTILNWYQDISGLIYVLLGFLKSLSMFYLLLHLN